MSSISAPLRKQIERSVESQPLAQGEFRRIEGMGSHFISLIPEHEGKQHLFCLVLGGKKYFIYKL